MLCISLTKYICLTQNQQIKLKETEQKKKKTQQGLRKQDLHILDLGESLL